MDDPEVQSKVLFFFEQFWSFFAVSIGVALGGMAAKGLVSVVVPAERTVEELERKNGSRASLAELIADPKLPIWYRFWRATISTHPVIVGGLAGLTPIPAAGWVPESTAARVLWFALAGALSGQVYEMGKRLSEIALAFVRKQLGLKSEPPPPPPSPTEPTEPTDKEEPTDKDTEQ